MPLDYESRLPELQLTDQSLNADMEQVLAAAELDEQQEGQFEREFADVYHLITRDDRLEKIAGDIGLHFMGRGQTGKAMVVCVDQATAVRMYDKVQKHWLNHLALLLAEEEETFDLEEKEEMVNTIRYMHETDMAVVISQGQNEIADFRDKGLDIAAHRRRMQTEDLETKFKDPQDPFRLVFVSAMWMAGFDASACSTLYLDKPMRNHTLMQAISQANRVFGEDDNAVIVDYLGVFRDLPVQEKQVNQVNVESASRQEG